MTNYEWLMKQDEETIKTYLAEGFAVVDEKLLSCEIVECTKCKFCKKDNCTEARMEWLNEKHVEKPVNPNWDVDTKVLVSSDGMTWNKRYFSIFCDTSEKPYACFFDGTTSWSATGVTYWKYAKLAEE